MPFTQLFHVSGLHCEACEKFIQMKVKKIPGVIEAKVSNSQHDLQLVSERSISLQEVIQALAGTEYTVSE